MSKVDSQTFTKRAINRQNKIPNFNFTGNAQIINFSIFKKITLMRRKNRKKHHNFWNFIFINLVILNMLAYQLAPVFLARAEAEDEAVSSEEKTDDFFEKKNAPDDKASTRNEDEDFSNQDNAPKNDAPAATASEQSELLLAPLATEEKTDFSQCHCPEGDDFNKPFEEKYKGFSSDCIQICEKAKIKNINEADIRIDSSSASNTGSNSTGSLQADESKDANTSENQTTDLPAESLTDAPCQEDNNCFFPANSEIDTGEASAVSLIYNETNKNKTGCNFLDLVYILAGNYNEDINLYQKFKDLLDSPCFSLSKEKIAAILVENINTAIIKNLASAKANSGNNHIYGALNGDINTGNAAALADIINLVNLNFVGDNWLFAFINVLGQWNGNLIVPGQGVLKTPASGNVVLEVENDNLANVTNTAESSVQTGGNSIENAGGAQIKTGEASAFSRIFNLINTNIVNHNWFFLLINNAGSWVGNILNWNTNNNLFSNIFQYDFGSVSLADITGQIAGFLKVKNINSAEVENTAAASANTGENSINGASSASIETGNATALSRIFNFINANIVGNNWFFALVNVFGSWNGNLEFAYPDLAISISDGRDKAKPGETLNYIVTIRNQGRAECEDSKVMLSLGPNLEYASTNVDLISTNGGFIWNSNGLKPGEERSFRVSVKINAKMAPGTHSLAAAAGVTTSTAEYNTGNNFSEDRTSVRVKFASIKDSALSIRRIIDNPGPLNPGQQVKHTFFIQNKGKNDLFNVVLKDTVYSNDGQSATVYQWTLGKLKKDKALIVDYTLRANNVGFNIDLKHEAQAFAQDKYKNDIASRKVSQWLTIFGFTNRAEAAGSETLGEEVVATAATPLPADVKMPPSDKIPWWIWLMALCGYYLAIRWSLNPKAKGSSYV